MADVSVVIPCYNAERFIEQTLGSVFSQTDRPREVIVIDDGSTDGSVGVMEKYVQSLSEDERERFTLIRQENAGESRARNVGIDRSTCEFVAFLDADDLWLPEKIAKQLEAFEKYPDAVEMHTRVFNFEQGLDDRGRAETEKTKDEPSVEDLMTYHYVAPSSSRWCVTRFCKTVGCGSTKRFAIARTCCSSPTSV